MNRDHKPSRDPEPTWWSDALLVAFVVVAIAAVVVAVCLAGGWL